MADIDDELEAAEGPRQHPLLTDAEVDAAKKKALDRITAARRKNAIAAVEATEEARLMREEGLTTGDGAKDEIVSITVDLPEFCASINFNGEPRWHGRTYKVPRHVADSMREVIQNTWRHQEREIEGKDLTASYRKSANRAPLTPLSL